ncbi:YifB family Mg chelatase-like AAA ATPase [bacterium]|jgi:magnesium chelatase family protein|nr:YifB family Mg chelatase-like AAA ATPase [bacterium]MBT3581194.1 YifB family Mg chelatase-like AAA ATPase [bacterium]MBT4551911.1 YifB family Mg chelatase-like AAA ATPase [bacterium]MBT7088768.1 YifB family Mg chelatase-like AAA ATPase [bacterium]
MLAKIRSVALFGIAALDVTVEVDATRGLPGETIVGLPDTVIRESKNRIRAAIKNSGLEYPLKLYTINLAPAEIKKEGPLFDLPIAVGILQATGQLAADPDSLYVGELALDGTVKPVRGIISICDMALKKNIKKLFIPFDNWSETYFFQKLTIIPVRNLLDVLRYFSGKFLVKPNILQHNVPVKDSLDYVDVKGQEHAKRGLEIAAAGGHNILFIGAPGSGKTMLLKRLPSILPKMSVEEATETNKIYSVNNRDFTYKSFKLERPFRSPHHSISYAGMAGGGKVPNPGEISLAHNGVLFLDELPEFMRPVIEVLRQPLEEKQITISRANFTIDYPANFMLVAAMNPCPCGYYKDEKVDCVCRETQRRKYWKKISGPILDRVDLIMEVPRLKIGDYFAQGINAGNVYTSEKMRSRVLEVRQRQEKRFGRQITNANMSPRKVRKYCKLNESSKVFLTKIIEKGFVTGRSFDKILKIARTIADLEGEPEIKQEYVAEAVQYRKLFYS